MTQSATQASTTPSPARGALEILIRDFAPEKLEGFFRKKIDTMTFPYEPIDAPHDEFTEGKLCGEASLPADGTKFIVATFRVLKKLSERSGKKAQYELGKQVLKEQNAGAGIFVFYDENGDFRFSLIYTEPQGRRRDWSPYRRYTYFVSKWQTNKTFLRRIGEGNFSSLEAIREAFSVDKVTSEFYQEIANWYFWAHTHSTFPPDAEAMPNGRSIALIRLITRLMFIWFMRERGLVPKKLFDEAFIKDILRDLSPEAPTYYLAILQNLFFATLSTRQENRRYRSEARYAKGWNPDHGNPYVFRHHKLFRDPKKLEELFGNIPFLNGGLFECLDEMQKDESGRISYRYIDGFTERKKYQPHLPNFLFFSPEQTVDLSKVYGKESAKARVRGILDILTSYNFTIDENTPDDAEVALDPELLGRVFEGLLASFNPETQTTARKATGSYYTPREVVDFIVVTSLKEYLKVNAGTLPNLEDRLQRLFNPHEEENPFSEEESRTLVRLIESVRIVDPAVGSGAFVMGALNVMVRLLAKLDPRNTIWKEVQLAAAEAIPDPSVRQTVKAQIEARFREKNADYGRKLYLIQKCIYGVDIQHIAVEIAKLRFFIALLVDETIDEQKENRGIEPLPNLDFKLMQGDSLITTIPGLEDLGAPSGQGRLEGIASQEEEEEAALVREFERKKEAFQNEPDAEKKNALRKEIENLIILLIRARLKQRQAAYFREVEAIERKYAAIPNKHRRAELIEREKQQLAKKHHFDWAPLEKQLRTYSGKFAERPFFLWDIYFAEVFREKGGFDIVSANPPYIQLQNRAPDGRRYNNIYKDAGYETLHPRGDIYCLFYELGVRLLREGGILGYITSNKWLRAGYGEKLRRFLQRYNLLYLIDLGPNVFAGATVDTNILILQKAPRQGKACALEREKDQPLGEVFSKITSECATAHIPPSGPWFIGSPGKIHLKEKIERIGKPLKEWDVNIYYGIKTGLNEAFIIPTETRDAILANCNSEEERRRTEAIIKPLLRGRDIHRYYYEWAGLWLIGTFPSLHLDINDYPALKNYFLKNFDIRRLEQSGKRYPDLGFNARKKTGNQWFETQDQIAYHHEFEKEKVVYSEIVRHPQFHFDDEKFYVEATAFLMTGEKVKYLCGLLNSTPITYFSKIGMPAVVWEKRGIVIRKPI